MQQRGEETEKAQKGLKASGGQPGEKRESKAGRIIRNVVLWAVILAMLALFIMLVAKKCSGQI